MILLFTWPKIQNGPKSDKKFNDTGSRSLLIPTFMYYAKCDQFEGLLELLKDIKK